MYTFILALAMQCFLPLFSASADFLGLSLVNSESQSREFTITATPSGGSNGAVGRLTVPANGQQARLIGEMLSPVPSAGWLSVDPAPTNCAVYLAAGVQEALGGVEGAGALSMSVVLPHLAIRTGFFELDASDTRVLIVNPGTSAATVSVQLLDMSGNVRTTVTLNVTGRGSHEFRASDPLKTVLPGNGMGGITFQGYARVTSTAPIAAWQLVETPLSQTMLRGRPAEDLKLTSLAIIPHFVFGGAYGSFINLINPDTKTVTLDLSAHDNQGNVIGEVIRLVLAPGESRRSSVGEFFRVILPAIYPAPVITGYIRIREASFREFILAGDVDVFGVFQAARGSSMMSWIADAASTQWKVPFAASSGQYFTGYAVVAQNDLLTVQTDVTVDVAGPDGVVISRTTHSLSPRHRIAALITPGVSGGYIRITSNLPVFVLGTIGTRDLQTLEALPARSFQ
jgi:hypothetical protein